jgi:uncharacterized caspase-like protein
MVITQDMLKITGIALLSLLLISCSGTTAQIRVSDVNIERQDFALTPYRLGDIDVSSKVGTFGSSKERKTLQQSIEKMLKRANLFGKDQSKPYSLDIQVEEFDIAQASFGSFDSLLSVSYQLSDNNGNVVFDDIIDSSGADDTGSSLGPVRQNRSRTVAVAENIQLFIESLASSLQRQSGVVDASVYGVATGTKGLRPKTSAADLPDVQLKSLNVADLDYGNYHALIIGNNAYTRITPLVSAVRDARRLQSILQQLYGFETTLLLDASRDAIINQLTRYRRELGPNDNLLIYYAGHGWLDEDADEGYWLPIDAEADDPARWLSNSTLTTSIRTLKAKHVLVIADSCFSGKLTRDAGISIRGQDYVSRLARKKARTVMTSGGLEPVVDSGGKDGHSVFASALFNTLEKNTGVVDTSLMFNVIRREVALNAEQFPEYGDIRRAGHDGGDFLFVRLNP